MGKKTPNWISAMKDEAQGDICVKNIETTLTELLAINLMWNVIQNVKNMASSHITWNDSCL